MSEPTMDFGTPEARQAFKRAYDEARDAGQESFKFQQGEVVVDYAYYVLEHLFNCTGDESLIPVRGPDQP